MFKMGISMRRGDYYKKIWQYEKRRSDIRKKYGSRLSVGYAQRVMMITRKINQWKLQIKRIDKRNKKIESIQNSINSYFCVNIRDKIKSKTHSLARNCYYKYGMEHGIEGSKLSRFIGRSLLSAHKQRTRFTRSFKTNNENKQQYHNFLNSLNNQTI